MSPMYSSFSEKRRSALHACSFADAHPVPEGDPFIESRLRTMSRGSQLRLCVETHNLAT